MAERQSVKPYAYAYFLPQTGKKDTLPDPVGKEAMASKKQGKGNPFKRGDTWTYIVYVKDPETGKRKQKWVGGFRTKKEATDALAKARIETSEDRVSTWRDSVQILLHVLPEAHIAPC